MENKIELEEYGESNATLYIEATTPEQVVILKTLLKLLTEGWEPKDGF